MKYIICFFITTITFKTFFCQSITNKDSVNANCKIYEGIIESNKFEGGYGTYTLAVSRYYNYIEISIVYWTVITVKYRLERPSNFQIFSITKTMSQGADSITACYIAIDSSMTNEIKKGKVDFNELNNAKIYMPLRDPEPIVFSLFFEIIIKHNLQAEYLKYDPKSFVAWLKVKK